MQLARVILFQLAETPMSYEHLVRWIRCQHRRIVPEAVGRQVCELQRVGLIECAEQKWRVRCQW